MAEKMYSAITEYTIMILGRMNNRGRSCAAFSSSLPLKIKANPSNRISPNKNCIVTIQHAVFHERVTVEVLNSYIIPKNPANHINKCDSLDSFSELRLFNCIFSQAVSADILEYNIKENSL